MQAYADATQEHDGWGYTMYLKNQESSLFQQNWHLTCGKVGIINDREAPIYVFLNNCVLTQGPHVTAWGIHLYECGGTFKDLTIAGLGSKYHQPAVDSFNGDGHSMYLEPAGPLEFRGLRIIGNGGNLQMVNRAWGYPDASGNPMVSAAPPKNFVASFKDGVFHNNAYNAVGNGGGGASHVSNHMATPDGGTTIIKGCSFTSSIPYSSAYGEDKSRAFVTLWNECWGGAPKLKNPNYTGGLVGNLNPNPDLYHGYLIVSDSSFRTTIPDRPSFNIQGTQNVRFDDWRYESIAPGPDSYGQVPDLAKTPPVVSIDEKPDNPQRAQYIDIAPVDGAPSHLLIRHTLEDGSVNIEPLSKGYKWGAK